MLLVYESLIEHVMVPFQFQTAHATTPVNIRAHRHEVKLALLTLPPCDLGIASLSKEAVMGQAVTLHAEGGSLVFFGSFETSSEPRRVLFSAIITPSEA